MLSKILIWLVAFIGILMVSLVLSFPLTWVIMLFLGNLGLKLSFWSCLPGALIIGVLRTPAINKSLNEKI